MPLIVVMFRILEIDHNKSSKSLLMLLIGQQPIKKKRKLDLKTKLNSIYF